jgi:hypothetical protein
MPAKRLIGFAAVAACFALNAAIAFLAIVKHPALNSDFMAFWSFPRFAAGYPVAGLYDAARLQAFQQNLYPGFHSFYPYLYPPTLLLATWWLAAVPFATAQTIWTLAGLMAFLAAGLAFFRKDRFAVLAMLASPAALLTGATGETGFFTTALLLGGFALLPARPMLAGLCFGLLTLKPQLGVLIPFALLGLGAWRAIGAASVTALALVAASCIAFPPGLWLVWLHALPAYQNDYFAAVHQLNLNIIVTPAADFLILGAGARTALALQAMCGVALAGATFILFRRAPYRLAAACLFAGMFLAVPHAYAYDTIPLTAALAIASRAGAPGWPMFLLGGVIYLAPFLLLSPLSRFFLYAFPEFLLYAALVRFAAATSPTETGFHEPDPWPIRP